ncbi:MAG: transglycosylase SLT domain-containing protein [Xanthobacteraceae bacterium]|nr:transglycosylase SLT domain-containing protein [Xanthobacteraceae bacterium]
MKSGFRWWGPIASVACALIAPAGDAVAGPHDALITKHAATHGVPESLVRRVIHIESKGNPRVVSKGNFGLMQIRLGTAKAMGYRGTADGLLDADTNMTYAVKYLALAYRAAGCSESGAIAYYQRGFYKKPRGKCAAPQQPTTQIAKVESPARQGAQRSVASDGEASSLAQAEVLKPRVVQVQTITRPRSPTPPAAPQPVAAQPAATQPVAPPVQVAVASTLAAAPPSAQVQPVVPQAVPSPHTVAKAPEQDTSAAPQTLHETSHAIPTVFMELLPMPRPRPATAPKMVAKLDVAVVSESSSKSDAPTASSDLQIMKPEPAVAPPMPKARPATAPQAVAKLDAAVASDLQIMKPEPAAAPPMPKRRPAKAPQTVAKLDSAVASEPSPNSDASTVSPDVQVAKLDATAVPLPQPKPVIDAVPEEESKQVRGRSQRHTRVARHRAPKQQENALVTFWRNLTTPQQPARRR